MNLTDAVNLLLKKTTSKSKHETQTIINDHLLFRRNSVNLLFGRKGTGKTYNVFREMIKLSHIPGFGDYHQIVYVTNQLSNDTFLKMRPYI